VGGDVGEHAAQDFDLALGIEQGKKRNEKNVLPPARTR
jgi:hypothetical protein